MIPATKPNIFFREIWSFVKIKCDKIKAKKTVSELIIDALAPLVIDNVFHRLKREPRPLLMGEADR